MSVVLTIERVFTVQSPLGLHARPAGRLASLAGTRVAWPRLREDSIQRSAWAGVRNG